MSDDKKLRDLVHQLYLARHDAVQVSPSWLATEAMAQLDPKRSSDPSIYLAAHLQFRQIARSVLRGHVEREDDSVEQHPLFPALQLRYPIPRPVGEEPQYKRLEFLSQSELAFNVARLRREAAGRLKHADALEAWARSRPNRSAA